jgi:ABC-type proline/glycine betaine transport system permease subunit
MNTDKKHIGFWISLALFVVVVPYSALEWFDKSIPYSPALYFISGLSVLLLVVNTYYFLKR